MTTREEKKAQFQQKSSSGKLIVGAVIGIVAIAVAAYGFWNTSTSSSSHDSKTSYNVGAKVDYTGKMIAMAKLPPVSANDGKIVVPLDEVKSKSMIRTEFKSGNKTIPIMAYVAPSGQVVAAVSMCEPCESTTFTIKGKQLACNACDTRWDPDTLKGLSGGCQTYPPDQLSYTVEGNNLILDAQTVSNWKPRI
ncbi:DUF2318 domain-containing protein [Heliobacillus mobilis]|uniref:DUF2318 domain-containing protein n=1 Tax=Heliobacterium mobile TaxID=28064 RepID=A0A6I3SIM2_HELMO|nr:DUF2318 domain-containing protein [Heliobacterium mobile]MTV48625.1 DUF2318 domain-containing protein [Heliobacterium mobile]